jgi:hypothetical protein
MDERMRIFFCVLAGAAGLGVVGGAFGALARVLFLASGRAAGSRVGAAAVRVLEDVFGMELSETARGAVSGGADGACFLGVVGALAGLLVGFRGPSETSVLLYIVLGALVLAGAAVVFGVGGYVLAHSGVSIIGFLFVGGILGAILGSWVGGTDGLLVGTLGGAMLGTAAAVFMRPGLPAQDEEPEPPAASSEEEEDAAENE